MNFATQFWIEQQIKRVETSCYSAQANIRNTKTMKQVKQCVDISIPSEIQFMKNSIHGLRTLKIVAENQMNEILEQQLSKIKEQTTPEDAKLLVSQYLTNDWQFLRGDYSEIYRKADFESHKILKNMMLK
ncbi:hypothetical protein GW796_10390 [archaeon]|nr:hypothetical protein [archaeon]